MSVQTVSRLVLVLLLGGVVWVAYLASQIETGGTATPEIACRRAHEYAKGYLRAPATAEFPGLLGSGCSARKEGDVWTVRSWVDAENGFGAKIRTHFTAKVRQAGSVWSLVNLQVD